MLLYLCQSYTKYEDKHIPFQKALEWCDQLEELGFIVYSPIRENYYASLHHKRSHEFYVQRSLKLLESWSQTLPYCGTEDQGYDRGSGFHDGCIDCNLWYNNPNENRTHITDPSNPSRCKLKEWVQPNICCVFTEDCLSERFIDPIPLKPASKPMEHIWFVDGQKSKGAREEYRKAHEELKIKCVRYEDLKKIALEYLHAVQQYEGGEYLGEEQIQQSIKDCRGI